MNFSVLINNYNYGQFLGRAIQSVVEQKPEAQEILVVDDGSTDDSLAVAKGWEKRDHRVRLIAKPNGGQLSAFNAGFAASQGSIICFLDADDEFKPGYLARLAEVYSTNPQVDFVFCRCDPVNASGRKLGWEIDGGSRDFGLTFCRSYWFQQWLSAPTSCVSARRSLLSRFLPCPLENDWPNCADNILTHGASLLLGRKYYIAEKLVRYHFHGENHWFGRADDPAEKLIYQIKIARLIQHLTAGVDLTRNNIKNAENLLITEFKNIPNPDWQDVKTYWAIARLHSEVRYWRTAPRIVELWIKAKFRGKSGNVQTDSAAP